MLCENCGREIDLHSLLVDLDTNTLRVHDGRQVHDVKLTPQEAELAYVLVAALPKVVEHEELRRNLWPTAEKPGNPNSAVRYYVSRLRRFLRPYGWGVISVFGKGYRLEREPA